ncbi:MAG: hypothetical protein K2X32_09795 [Phycisphaerales bacterium]|nr:hypothetical protein [Phycisphaerales bacterium]
MIEKWLTPWDPIQREDERLGMQSALAREIDVDHPLWGLAVVAIARRQDNDDVLFSLADGRLAVVHLCWAGKKEKPPFPWTTLYMNEEAFVRNGMIDDCEK